MSVKFHKRNTNFQKLYFLVGSCHTPDMAYFMLKELKEEREGAINNYKVVKLRTEARKQRALQFPNNLENQADLLEIEYEEKTSLTLYEASLDELKFIDEAIAAINPHRSYKDLPDIEAHEAAEREEWKLELLFRAENFMLTSGSIPADHFATMRMHPDFKLEIYPQIEYLISNLNVIATRKSLMERVNKLENILQPLLINKESTCISIKD